MRMKWFGRIAFVFLLVVIGMSFYNSGVNKQAGKLKETADEFIDSDPDKYLDIIFASSGIEKYLETPIYKGVFTGSGKKSSTLSIHQTIFNNNGEDYYYLWLWFDSNENFYDMLLDKDKYMASEKEGQYLAYVVYEIHMGEIDNEDTTMYGSANIYRDQRSPVVFLDMSSSDYSYLTDKTSKVINRISVSFYDFTTAADIEKDDPVITPFLILDNTNTGTNGEEILELNEDGVIVSKNFNGNYDAFNKKDDFKDESLVVLTNYKERLKPYVSVLITEMVKFVVIAIVVTYLLFFLKPTINYFKDRKYQKNKLEKSANTENVLIDAEVEPIFRDIEEDETKK
ncbi:MAG: hypothetical protein RBQ97_03720 [Acholeplasma sp.]|nr:hypothetical protein [Acholeplasma sp.]